MNYTQNGLKVAKQRVLEKLKNDLNSEGNTVTTTTRFYVKIPLCVVHTGHPVGASASYNQTVDKRIIEKIYDLVSRGVTRPDEVRRCIDEYVERELLSTIPAAARPQKSNRKYYPTRQDLRNHITKAISAHKYSKDDQESLKIKVQEWEKQGDGKFFYRPRSSQDTDEKASVDKFLFVQQEKWQQNLLRRYGSNLVLMDATYKTTKYALPLFFVCVHCNVGYKVVASFICQNEDADSISEALSIIKSWNTWWNPSYFMVDFSTAEINAIEQQFPNSQVYICDFHRIQAWQRWSRTGKNGLTAGQQEAFLAMLQRVAYSRSKKQFEEALVTLRNSKVYRNNMKAKDYVEKVWMPCVKRWAHVYRNHEAVNIVNTNNGVEAQNKHFKYSYLPRSVDKSVYAIVVMLVECFIPDSYQHYIETNIKQSSMYRKYGSDVPKYLHNRPSHFLKHCMKSRFAAGAFREGDVECLNFAKCEFKVKSSSNSKLFYNVDLQVPRCSCEAWLKCHFPCKHFFAVFNTFDECSFNTLPESYKNSVFITLDVSHAECMQPNQNDDENLEKADSNARSGRLAENDGGNSDANEESMDLAMDSCMYNNDEVHEAKKTCDSLASLPSYPQPASSSSQPKEANQRQVLLNKIDVIRNTVFCIDNITCLQETIEGMEEIERKMSAYRTFENGLPTRISPVKKKLKVTSIDYHKVLHRPLSLRRKRKGYKKEKCIRSNPVVIDLTSSPTSKNTQVCG